HLGSPVPAEDGQHQAVAARRPPQPARRLRLLRRAGNRQLRGRPVRARGRARAEPVPGLAVPRRRAQRRRADRLQPARDAERPAFEPLAAGAGRERLPLGLRTVRRHGATSVATARLQRQSRYLRFEPTGDARAARRRRTYLGTKGSLVIPASQSAAARFAALASTLLAATLALACTAPEAPAA